MQSSSAVLISPITLFSAKNLLHENKSWLDFRTHTHTKEPITLNYFKPTPLHLEKNFFECFELPSEHNTLVDEAVLDKGTAGVRMYNLPPFTNKQFRVAKSVPFGCIDLSWVIKHTNKLWYIQGYEPIKSKIGGVANFSGAGHSFFEPAKVKLENHKNTNTETTPAGEPINTNNANQGTTVPGNSGAGGSDADDKNDKNEQVPYGLMNNFLKITTSEGQHNAFVFCLKEVITDSTSRMTGCTKLNRATTENTMEFPLNN
jgi:hypothetical protein